MHTYWQNFLILTSVWNCRRIIWQGGLQDCRGVQWVVSCDITLFLRAVFNMKLIERSNHWKHSPPNSCFPQVKSVIISSKALCTRSGEVDFLLVEKQPFFQYYKYADPMKATNLEIFSCHRQQASCLSIWCVISSAIKCSVCCPRFRESLQPLDCVPSLTLTLSERRRVFGWMYSQEICSLLIHLFGNPCF